jgi:hypothetical protein
MKNLLCALLIVSSLFSCGNNQANELKKQILSERKGLETLLNNADLNEKMTATKLEFLKLESEAIDLLENSKEKAESKRNLAKKYFDISDQLKIEANKISKKQQKIDSLENILKSL